jgi:hypothetical protein
MGLRSHVRASATPFSIESPRGPPDCVSGTAGKPPHEREVVWVPGGRAALQRRLLDAIAKGDTRVSPLDVAGLDDGGRIRKAALHAVLDPGEYLGDFSDADLAGGEPLAKSGRPSKIEVTRASTRSAATPTWRQVPRWSGT